MCLFVSLLLQLISFSCKEETSWQNKTKLTATDWEHLLQLFLDHIFFILLGKNNEVHFKRILKMHVVKLDFIPLQFLLLKAENLLYFLSHFCLIGLSLDMCLHHIVHLLWLALLIANLNPFFYIFETEGFGSNLIGTKLKNIFSTVF